MSALVRPVTVTATVHNLDTVIPPFGSASLWINDEYFGTTSLDDNGQVAGSLTPNAPGDYAVRVDYTDDTGPTADFLDSSASFTEHVNPAPAQTAVSTASVTSAPPSAPTPAPVQVVLGTRQTARKCTVPQLKGMKLAAAKTKLARAHCQLGKVTRKKARRALRGKVIATKPSAGKTTASKVAGISWTSTRAQRLLAMQKVVGLSPISRS
jgi:hypothetical protein